MVSHGAEACNYLLAVDVDMNTVEGYAMASWETGYGDFEMKPDFDTLRLVPWHEGTAMCMADLQWHGDKPVAASPRQILRRQLDRLAERGWTAFAATELEFIVFRDTYEQAFHKRYQDLEPGNLYNVDYSMLGTSRLEPLIGRIRREMARAGLRVENSKGECNFGQHEINFTYETALHAADTHTIYKNGAKEIASQEGMAITFMAKYDEREGNSCHIHLSVRGEDGTPVFAEQPELFERFLAGQLACLRELTLFKAPNVNSYKRFAEGSFAPTAVAWGRDNRTCSMRVIGEGQSLRVESRLAGGDVNPYLAIAAMIAVRPARDRQRARARAGAGGQRLHLRQAARADARCSDARDLFAGSDGRARGVRAGRRRPLPQQRRRRAARLRGGRHRLGALPGLRAAVSRRPVIGICASVERARWTYWDEEAAVLSMNYVRQVHEAGGIAVLLAARPATRRSCCGCSTGCCSPAARTSATRPSATRSSWRSRRPALEADVPVLGVCRGMQVMNVARGGTLIEHLPDKVGHEDHRLTPGAFGDHDVRLRRGLARAARRARGRAPDQVAPPPGRRRGRRRASRSRAGRRSTTCRRRSRTRRSGSRSASSGTRRPTSARR